MINEKYANAFCIEDISKIENYELAVNDNTQTWCCHHRREIDENKSKSQLIAEKLYYHRPASELIFLTKSDHVRLHSSGERNHMFGKRGEKSNWFGKHHSDETRKKMSISRIGKPSWLGKHHSDETKKKLSISNSGEKNPMFGKPGYWSGKRLSAETRKKMSVGRIGRKWFTNGVDEIFQYECPPGFVPGRAKGKHRASRII